MWMLEPKPKLTKPISKPNFKAHLCVIVTSIKACLIGIFGHLWMCFKAKTMRDRIGPNWRRFEASCISKPNFKAHLCMIVTSIKARLIGIFGHLWTSFKAKTIRDRTGPNWWRFEASCRNLKIFSRPDLQNRSILAETQHHSAGPWSRGTRVVSCFFANRLES